MTHEQSRAVWELCRQGYPMSADEAEMCWRDGQHYEPDDQMSLPRALRALIDHCNYEASAKDETKPLH